MSLYNESIEVVEYEVMKRDIERNRQRIESAKIETGPLKDRPDIVIDEDGELWTLAPVSRNYGLLLPIFYRFESVPSKGRTGKTNRSQSARKVRYPNGRIVDREPKTAKVKR